MERLVRYKVNFDSKWITASCCWMGVAFFLQILDYFGIRMMQGIGFGHAILLVFIPALLEASWCVCLRIVKSQNIALVLSILAAVFCLLLAVQMIIGEDNLFLTILSVALLLLSGASVVLIFWGFVPKRWLGMLILIVTLVLRLLSLDLAHWIRSLDWISLVRNLSVPCILIGIALSSGGVYAEKIE